MLKTLFFVKDHIKDLEKRVEECAALLHDSIVESCVDILFLVEEGDEEQVRHISAMTVQVPFQQAGILMVPFSSPMETLLEALENEICRDKFDLVVFSNGDFGGEAAVRLGHRIGGKSCLNISYLEERQLEMYVEKRVYASNLTGGFMLVERPYLVTAEKGLKKPGGSTYPIKAPTLRHFLQRRDHPWLHAYEEKERKVDNSLSEAPVVIVVGRGLGGKHHLEKVKALALKLKAAVGASRPVVINAWMELDQLVGVSGSVIAPRLLIALGVSGSGAFRAGIERSCLIVSVNVDEQAPINALADAVIIHDLNEFVEAWVEQIDGKGGVKK